MQMKDEQGGWIDRQLLKEWKKNELMHDAD